MNDKIYNLLYVVDDDDDTGLREVQLTENPSSERIEQTKLLLSNNDDNIAIQAALILTAWAIEDGINKLKTFVETYEKNNVDIFVHRINDNNTTFDSITYAVYLNLYLHSNKNNDEIDKIILLLIKLYPKVYAEDYLKKTLLFYNKTTTIIEEVIYAIDETILQEKYFMASFLLPVLFKNKHLFSNNYLNKFIKLEIFDARIGENIVDALAFENNTESQILLEQYSKSTFPLIREKAINILNKQ